MEWDKQIYGKVVGEFKVALKGTTSREIWKILSGAILFGNYMFKVNNRNTRKWRRSGIFIVNFENISHLVIVFLLITLSR